VLRGGCAETQLCAERRLWVDAWVCTGHAALAAARQGCCVAGDDLAELRDHHAGAPHGHCDSAGGPGRAGAVRVRAAAGVTKEFKMEIISSSRKLITVLVKFARENRETWSSTCDFNARSTPIFDEDRNPKLIPN
jgi:hypothetical protein